MTKCPECLSGKIEETYVADRIDDEHFYTEFLCKKCGCKFYEKWILEVRSMEHGSEFSEDNEYPY